MNEFNSDDKVKHVYNYSASTSEFIGESDVFIPAGTGLPAYCTVVAPPLYTPGFACIFGGVTWQVIEDHRNKIAYDITNQSKITVFVVGALPENVTLLKPASEFDEWNGEEWIKNNEKEKKFYLSESEEKIKNILMDVSIKTNHLQTKLFMGVITEAEKTTLSKWVSYVDKLNALDLTTAPDILWPELPV